MTFAVGETVVYPHHGAALIEAIETRTIKGEDKIYLVLKVAQGDLTVDADEGVGGVIPAHRRASSAAVACSRSMGRSNLPLGLRGSCSRHSTRAGTM